MLRAIVDAASGENGSPTFFVRDDGMGFDTAYAQKLFTALHTLHRRTEFPGTGIGLATVQRIVTRHGGTVSATGAPDTGATWDRLAALGCDAAQGFYISPPVPFDEVTTWLARWRDSTGVPQCPECDRRGTARRETTVQGKTVTGVWRCTACQVVWSVARTD